MGIQYDTDRYPRLAYDVAHPVMGIGELCMLDLQDSPMSVMLQGKKASDEIIRLRQENQRLRESLAEKELGIHPLDAISNLNAIAGS